MKRTARDMLMSVAGDWCVIMSKCSFSDLSCIVIGMHSCEILPRHTHTHSDAYVIDWNVFSYFFTLIFCVFVFFL